jgi:alkanesulfonate monooxygenase
LHERRVRIFWYIPNDVKSGHRGYSAVENDNSLETLIDHVKALEEHGWKDAPIGTGCGRPDTVAAVLAARITTLVRDITEQAWGDTESLASSHP